MLSALALVTCLGAGTVGGVFYAFSTFVMKALSELPTAHGLAAMQRINVVVINPLFLGLFMGTALIAVLGIVFSLLFWSGARSVWLLAAAVLYLVGSFFVTIAFNVPRNQRLAGVDANAAHAAGNWATYVREWTFWNHVRTVASIASAACAAAALLT